MNIYTFDIPTLTTCYIRSETEPEARAKAAGFDGLERDVPLGEAMLTSPGAPELTDGDIIVTIAARGTPRLVRAHVADGLPTPVPVSVDPEVDLDQAIYLAEWVEENTSEIADMLARWSTAVGDDGCNDDEHDIGAEMAEFLERLTEAAKSAAQRVEPSATALP